MEKGPLFDGFPIKSILDKAHKRHDDFKGERKIKDMKTEVRRDCFNFRVMVIKQELKRQLGKFG